MLDIKYDITALEKLCDESGILVENVPFPMVITDADWRLMKANEFFHELTGIDGDNYSFNLKIWKDEYLEPITNSDIDRERHSVSQEFRYRKDSSRTFYLTIQEVYDDQETIAGYIALFRDTTDQRSYEKNLYMLANTDSLTGLYNRRFLYEYLQNHSNNLWSFMYLDLDGFKYINDNYGHSRGDEILKETADIIRNAFPDYKVVRLGGDEFAVLIDEELDEEFLNYKIEDFSREVEALFSDDNMTLSISVGLARRRGTEINIDELIHEGDSRMYEMKKRHHEKFSKKIERKEAEIKSREELLDMARVLFFSLDALPLSDRPTNDGVLDDICKALRIAKFDTSFYDNAEEEHKGNGSTAVLYADGEEDTSRTIENRYVTRGYNVAYYTVYQKKDETDWNDDEKDIIEYLIRIIYVMNGRSRLMKLAEKMKFYDNELQIHNIKYFISYVNRVVQEKKAGDYTAMFFNLKKFSVINQQLGRNTGTLVMKNYVHMIDEKLTRDEVVARVGGDNFVLFVNKEKADDILEILSGASVLYDEQSGSRVNVSANVGVFEIPEENSFKNHSDIMDRIATALNVARSNGTRDIIYFDDHMLMNKRQELMVSGTFSEAIANEEFVIYYQPKISVHDNSLYGAEALCRWIHDERLIMPAEFIPMLEKNQEICELDFYMLEHVCRDIRRWIDAGKRVVRVSVNFSRRHLADVDLLEHILETIDKYKVPHEFIEIELTETTTDVEFNDLKRIVRGLQENGIMTAVDDFGIGYSSLNLIRDIPWNVLKIDKSFLPVPGDLLADEKKLMFKYVVAMAQSIGLECIVEGVETEEQLSILKDNACEFAQGYYFDKPLPVDEFERKLDDFIYR